ncbi:MAG: hypothetical protein AAFR51_18180 [Pseudomonadota bacterium]
MRLTRPYADIIAGAVLVTACTQQSEPAPTALSETAILGPEDETLIEPSALFIACFKTAAKEHPLGVVQQLVAGTDEGSDAAALSDEDALAVALFLQSLDNICPGV